MNWLIRRVRGEGSKCIKRRLRKVSPLHCFPFASPERGHGVRAYQKVNISDGKEPFLCDGGWPGSEGRRHFLRREGIEERKLMALAVLLTLWLGKYLGTKGFVMEVGANNLEPDGQKQYEAWVCGPKGLKREMGNLQQKLGVKEGGGKSRCSCGFFSLFYSEAMQHQTLSNFVFFC